MTNPIEISRRLQQAGLGSKEADAIVESQLEMVEGKAATKADLLDFRLKIEPRIQHIENDLTTLKWMLGLVIGGIVSLILKAYF